VNLTTPEALALLELWKASSTALDVTANTEASLRKERAKIKEVSGDSVLIATAMSELKINLAGARFNGDQHAPSSFRYSAYLICEFQNDDRWTFYALRDFP
jgi:hypothetical protein